MSDFRTVYVSVGNSDDRLSQLEWAAFLRDVVIAIRRVARQVYGEWYSAPDAPFQNACVGFALHGSEVLPLQGELASLRTNYRQDSLAWAEVATTEMI